jgi:hypothetical protein
LAQPANPATLLLAWGRGDQAALDRQSPLIHDELRRLARRHMARARVGHTLRLAKVWLLRELSRIEAR